MRAFLRRLIRPTVPPAATPAPSSHNVLPAADWRSARKESPELSEAVERMEEHIAMIRQIADAWLLSANVHARDEAEFIRNVSTAREMANAFEWECAAVVDELRQLAVDADGRNAAKERLERAQAFIEWAHDGEARLHRRLRQLAAEAGLDAGDLRRVGRLGGPSATKAEAEALLPHFANGNRPPLHLCLK
jgi:hypothetical protein